MFNENRYNDYNNDMMKNKNKNDNNHSNDNGINSSNNDNDNNNNNNSDDDKDDDDNNNSDDNSSNDDDNNNNKNNKNYNIDITTDFDNQYLQLTFPILAVSPSALFDIHVSYVSVLLYHSIFYPAPCYSNLLC